MMGKFLNKEQKKELKDEGWDLFDNESGGVYFTVDGEQVQRGSDLDLEHMAKLDSNSTYKFLVFAFRKNEVIH